MITDCISDFVLSFQDQPARTNGSGKKWRGEREGGGRGREREEGGGERGSEFCFNLRPAGFNLVECTGKSANTNKIYF